MPRFAANLAYLFTERPLIERFGAAAAAAKRDRLFRIAANKVAGVRAALVWNEETARLAREHNLVQLSTGDILRDHVARDTELGRLGLRRPSAADIDLLADLAAKHTVLNTTIGVVATDAVLDAPMTKRLAMAGHDGLGRAIRPAHSPLDGDTIFALATGAVEVNPDPTTPASTASPSPREPTPTTPWSRS